MKRGLMNAVVKDVTRTRSATASTVLLAELFDVLATSFPVD
jgi:hypothetical protein